MTSLCLSLVAAYDFLPVGVTRSHAIPHLSENELLPQQVSQAYNTFTFSAIVYLMGCIFQAATVGTVTLEALRVSRDGDGCFSLCTRELEPSSFRLTSSVLVTSECGVGSSISVFSSGVWTPRRPSIPKDLVLVPFLRELGRG